MSKGTKRREAAPEIAKGQHAAKRRQESQRDNAPIGEFLFRERGDGGTRSKVQCPVELRRF